MIIILHHWNRSVTKCDSLCVDTKAKNYSRNEGVYFTGENRCVNYHATLREVHDLLLCCQVEGYKEI